MAWNGEDMTMDTALKISEFDQLSASQDRFGNKILLVAQHMDDGDGDYKDRYVTFEDFESQIYRGFYEYCGLNTMAFANKDDYSKADHTHAEYNKVSVLTAEEFTGYPPIASIAVGNSRFQIRQNFLPAEYVIREEIGELKFVATRTVPSEIDIYSEDFDGWVFANGKTYRTMAADEFSEAKKTFITSQDMLSFQVPKLENFIRPSLEPLEYVESYSDPVKSNTMQNVPPHSHEATFVFQEDMQSIMEIETALTSANRKKYVARGKDVGTASNPQISSTVNIRKMVVRNMETSRTGSTDEETYPTYNGLPVMIYIGKRR